MARVEVETVFILEEFVRVCGCIVMYSSCDQSQCNQRMRRYTT